MCDEKLQKVIEEYPDSDRSRIQEKVKFFQWIATEMIKFDHGILLDDQLLFRYVLKICIDEETRNVSMGKCTDSLFGKRCAHEREMMYRQLEYKHT